MDRVVRSAELWGRAEERVSFERAACVVESAVPGHGGVSLEERIFQVRKHPHDKNLLNQLAAASLHYLVRTLTNGRVRMRLNANDAEEAAQRACVRMMTDHFSEVLDPSVCYVPYLEVVARHEAVNTKREERILPSLCRVELRDAPSQGEDTGGDPKEPA